MKGRLFRFFMVVGGLALATMVGAAPLAPSQAQDAKAAYEKRVANMKAMGGAMGAISKVVKGEANYGPDTVAAAETVLATAKAVPTLFPAGSAVGDSRAKPEIWSDRANFEKGANALAGEAEKLLAAVRTGDKAQIGPALGAAGKVCGSCHDTYRKPQT